MSSHTQTGKAFIMLSLLCLVFGAVLQVHWLTVAGGIGIVCWYIDYSLVPMLRKRWHELLDAIRGKGQSSSESKQERDELEEEFEQQQKYERQIEAAHQKSQFKHVSGLPWGDPSSYVKALTPEELEQAREDFQKREADRYATLASFCLESQKSA